MSRARIILKKRRAFQNWRYQWEWPQSPWILDCYAGRLHWIPTSCCRHVTISTGSADWSTRVANGGSTVVFEDGVLCLTFVLVKGGDGNTVGREKLLASVLRSLGYPCWFSSCMYLVVFLFCAVSGWKISCSVRVSQSHDMSWPIAIRQTLLPSFKSEITQKVGNTNRCTAAFTTLYILSRWIIVWEWLVVKTNCILADVWLVSRFRWTFL